MGVKLYRAVSRTVKVRRSIDRLVLWVIADHANDETRIGWPSLRTISDLSGLDRKEVRRAIANLVAAGHVEITRGAPGRGHPNAYHVILPDTESDLIEPEPGPAEGGGVSPPFGSEKGGTPPPFDPAKGGDITPLSPDKGGGHHPPFTRLSGDNPRLKGGVTSPKRGGTVPPEPSRTLKEKKGGSNVVDAEEIKRAAIVDFVAGRRPTISEGWLTPERLAALRAAGLIEDADQKKLGAMYG